jgi:hypothetical protein
MRFCKLDWKPDAGQARPRIISGTRVIREVDTLAVLTDAQHIHLAVVLALLGRDIGVEEGRLDAMVQAADLGEVLVRTGA